MIAPKDQVIVGVSGGADSICLLFLLHELSMEMDFGLSAVHVNHQIRETAARDEKYVQDFCQKYQIPLHCESFPVLEIAKKTGQSVEEAGRSVRFQAFEKWMDDKRANKIALAHHIDDQAETVLFHLARGTGIDGLCGIRPVRDKVIHPLLCVTREEIEDFLKKEGLKYMTDETNAQDIYARNAIRHKILPVLEKQVSNKAKEHIATTSGMCLEASAYLEKQTQMAYEEYVCVSDNNVICVKNELMQADNYIQKSVIHKALAELSGSRKDIHAIHIQSVLSLFAKQTGRRIHLPYEICASKAYIGVELEKNTKTDMVFFEQKLIVDPKKETFYQIDQNQTIRMRVFEANKIDEVSQKTYTKWFDYDKINGCLTLRNRQSGDYLYVQEKMRQTLKAYMINEKIPQKQRAMIPIIADEDQVLWVIGYRISSYFKITKQTKTVLEITILGGKEIGRDS